MSFYTDPTPPPKHATILAMLALAADENAPEGERALAAERAAEWLAKAGLTEAQLRTGTGAPPPAVVIHPYATSGAQGHGQARRMIVYHVGEALGCRAILHAAEPTTGAGITILVGIRSDVDAARLLLPLVLSQAEYATSAALRRRELRPRNVGSFLIGYGLRIAQRIAERRARLAATDSQDAATLTDWQARVQALHDEKFPHLQTADLGDLDTAALRGGAEAGRLADLGDGLKNAQRNALHASTSPASTTPGDAR